MNLKDKLSDSTKAKCFHHLLQIEGTEESNWQYLGREVFRLIMISSSLSNTVER